MSYDDEVVRAARACDLAYRYGTVATTEGSQFDLTVGTVTLAKHDRRVGELLAANNREVERRRAAERRYELLKKALLDGPDGLGGDWMVSEIMATIEELESAIL